MKSILSSVLLSLSFCSYTTSLITSKSIDITAHHEVKNTLSRKHPKNKLQDIQPNNEKIKLSFCKPIGIVLHKNTAMDNGVVVDSVIEGGSAFKHIDKLIGLRISKVFSEDVLSFTCDQLKDVINSSPSPVAIEFTSHHCKSSQIDNISRDNISMDTLTFV